MPWEAQESEQDIRLPDTEQTGTHWDGGTGQQAQAAQERDDQEGRREWARGRDRDQGMGPASFQESQPLCGSCVAHAKRMHALGDSYTALPGLWVEAGTQAQPSPEV